MSKQEQKSFEGLEDVFDYYFGNPLGLGEAESITVHGVGTSIPEWIATVHSSDGESANELLTFSSPHVSFLYKSQHEDEQPTLMLVPIFSSHSVFVLDNTTDVPVDNIELHVRLFYPLTSELIQTKQLTWRQVLNNFWMLPLLLARSIKEILTSKTLKVN